MRGAGGDHGTEKRRSLWARTWEPSPIVTRPPVLAAEIPADIGDGHGRAGEGDRDAGMQLDALGRGAGDGERQEGIVLVFLGADAGIAGRLDRLGRRADLCAGPAAAVL